MMARVKYIAGIMGLQLCRPTYTQKDGGGILYAADIVFNMSFEWQIAHSQVSMMFGRFLCMRQGMLLESKITPGGRMQFMYAIAYPNQEKRSLHDFDLAMIDAIYG